MSEAENTLIGHVVDVTGGMITAVLAEDETGVSPTVTVGDEDILIGRLGSYVAIRQSDVAVLAIVCRMAEQEKVPPLSAGEANAEGLRIPYAQRTVSLVPVGTISAEGRFERGVSQYPTTGAEVHVVGAVHLESMFHKYRASGFSVGHLSTDATQRVFLDPNALFGRHFAVLGQTGAGKSWTVASIVQKAVELMPRAHVILLDLHGEYSWIDGEGVQQFAFNETSMRYIDARELEMPYWLMNYSELCDLLIDRTEFSAHNQLAVFRDIVNDLKAAEGERLGLSRTTLDTPVFFDLGKMRDEIESKNAQIPSATPGKLKNGPLTGAFDNFLMRLESRLGDVRYDFLLKPKVRDSSESLSKLLRDFVGLGDPKRAVTVIDVSSIPFDVRPTVAAQIGRLAFEFNYWNPAFREFPILLICEEAHAYIPRATEAQFAGSRKSMERIAKEGRKYGVGLGVVSQRPHEVSETVLAQCGTFVCLRITNPSDQTYVRGLVPEAERDLVEILAGLGRGETLVLGEAAPLPTRMQVEIPEPSPNSDDVDFLKSWKSGPDDIDVEAIVDRWRKQER